MTQTIKEWGKAFEFNSLSNAGKIIVRDWKDHIQTIILALEGAPMDSVYIKELIESLIADIGE